MAESVVVADNVEVVASNIQSKVGATLLGTRAMAEQTTGVQSEGSFNILEKIRELQFKTVEKITGVWEILKSQLDLEKDQARKDAENAKELALESQKKKRKGKGVAALVEDEGGGFDMKQMLATIGTTLLTVGGLRAFAGSIFKGGIWALIGLAAGKALVNLFDIESPSAIDAIKTTLPTAAAMLAMFKLKTALLATLHIVSALGIASITNWLTGGKAAHEVTNFDWASAALTGPALALFLRFGLGVKMGATLGGLVFGWPLIIAGSLALALGAGMAYVANSVEKIETIMLEKLKDTTEMAQDEFEEILTKQSTSAISKWSIGLQAFFDKDKLNLVQTNVMAVRGAKKQFGITGKLDPKDKEQVLKLADKYAKLTPDAVADLLADKHKLDDVANLKLAILDLAHSGALGDDKDSVLLKLMAWEEKINKGAEDRIKMLIETNQKVPTYVKEVAGGEHDTTASTYGDKFNIFKRIQDDTMHSDWLATQKHIQELKEDKDYVDFMKLKKKNQALPHQLKYIDDHEAKLRAVYESMGNRRTMKFEDGVWDMPSEVDKLAMIDWFDKAKNTNLENEILKIMKRTVLKLSTDEKKGEGVNVVDNKSVVQTSSSVVAPIVGSNEELGRKEEKALALSGTSGFSIYVP